MKYERTWQFILVIVGVLATSYAGYWLGNRPEKSDVITYRSIYNEDAKKIFGNAKEVTVLVKGEPVINIQSITFLLANTSNKNLGNVRVFFKVKSNKSGLLFVDHQASEDMPTIAMRPLPVSDGIRGYEFDYLNRTASVYAGAKVTFYFSGPEKPEVSVLAGSKGLLISEYQPSAGFSLERLSLVASKLWPVFLGYLIFSAISVYITRASRKLRERNFFNLVYEVVSDGDAPADKKMKAISEQYFARPSLKETIRSILE